MWDDRNTLSRNNKLLRHGGMLLMGISMLISLSACGKEKEPASEEEKVAKTQEIIDQNPDIFGWLVVPGTQIDYPIVQSMNGDNDFYRTHDSTGKENGGKGTIYIESYNMMDMCDFNTVLYGSTNKDGDMFSELWNFADKDFFEENDKFVIAISDNILTYEIWTAYVRENNDLLLQYDFTEREGCQQFLDDMKKDWTSITNVRKEMEMGATPDNFLVTLTTVSPENPDKQWVVVGCLIDDKNGTITREE